MKKIGLGLVIWLVVLSSLAGAEERQTFNLGWPEEFWVEYTRDIKGSARDVRVCSGGQEMKIRFSQNGLPIWGNPLINSKIAKPGFENEDGFFYDKKGRLSRYGRYSYEYQEQAIHENNWKYEIKDLQGTVRGAGSIDQNQRVLRQQFWMGDSLFEWLYQYNHQGKVIEKKSIGNGTFLASEAKKSYDESGRIIRSRLVFLPNLEAAFSIEHHYQYNSDGLLISDEMVHENNKKTTKSIMKTFYTYEDFDGHGNWKTRLEKRQQITDIKDGIEILTAENKKEVITKTTREITYYE